MPDAAPDVLRAWGRANGPALFSPAFVSVATFGWEGEAFVIRRDGVEIHRDASGARCSRWAKEQGIRLVSVTE